MRFRKIKKLTKQNKKEVQPKYIYAFYRDRIKALIIDMFMIYAPILYILTYLILDGKDDFQKSQIAPLIAVTLYGIIYAFLLSKFGQTPGKKAYDLKVVDAKSGKNIGFFRSFLRYIMFLFTATTILGLFLPLFRKDKKALHDLVCNTLVVKVKE